MRKNSKELEHDNEIEVKNYIHEQRENRRNAHLNEGTVSEDPSSIKKILKFLWHLFGILVVLLLMVRFFWGFDYVSCTHYVNTHCRYFSVSTGDEICKVNCDFKTVMTRSWEK